ncbi:GntR family transcriptional regulator [Tuberibacillus sp. Marseille-P3662]|uniref:GntR family transcriptional regulator n=1 Tax=Tuberibacillus sp. Marseille-P3662 TaxID=1965358 RepID=UPI000A1CA122|nr:GntR family transcriptional regulator [Tuberibacillus sp. Marseille-P3662]
MTNDFNPSRPIYLQIADRIIRQILRRELNPGDKLPSVRDMAVESGVNPNTVQRTYRELEVMRAVEFKRGQGTFVTEDHTALSDLRKQLKHEEISTFIQHMTEMGYTEQETIEGVRDYLQTKGESQDD